MIVNPLTVRPGTRVSEALEIMVENDISGLPVVKSDNTLHGIITNRDIRFEKNMDLKIDKVMTPKRSLLPSRRAPLFSKPRNFFTSLR